MTSVDKDIDPSDIGKHPNIIKAAQADMAQTDVLVCGKCHNVFHFVELFREHKARGCAKESSSLKECRETKPKVWAFLLWKASQLTQSEDTSNINSWKLYQTWVKMDDAIRETWVVAGRTIQSFGKMGAGSLQEMPVKITKTVVDSTTNENKKELLKKPPQAIIRPAQQASTPTNAAKPPLGQSKINQIQPKSRIAKRSLNESIQEDEIVEKILAKRFNPRKKQYEYLVKWEKYSHEQNTWEELSHFDQCKHLLDHFEEQLARQKEQRAKFQQIAQNKAAATTAASTTSATPTTQTTSVTTAAAGGRPIRSSKAKAMDQVKQWCASDDDNSSTSLKRKNTVSSADDDADDENQTDDPDDDFNFPAKKAKTDNVAVQQALIKAGQTGNVRIMPVSQRTNTVQMANKNMTPQKVLNGGPTTATASSPKQNSAEIVITKDAKGGTGVVKKPGVTINNNNKPITAGEAKVRVLAKGESVASGVVRIASQNDAAKGTTTTIARTAVGNRPVSSATTLNRSPNTITQQRALTMQAKGAQNAGNPQNKLTPVQKTQQQQQQQKRFSLSPETTSTVHNKTTITRMVRSNPNSTKTTPETSKVVTYRTADGKLVRRSFPLNSSSPKLNTSSKNSSLNESKPDAEDEEDDDNIADPFPAEITPPEPDSPPLPMSLCPITGKVLLKAEGEKTPPPSPDPAILEQQRAAAEQEELVKNELLKQEQNDAELREQQQAAEVAGGNSGTVQHIQPMTNEDGTPILVTGEDGTVYQIAGKNEEGQTILITQGADGEQQCVFVAADDDENGGVLGLAQGGESGEVNQVLESQDGDQTQFILKQQQEGDGESTHPTQTLTVNIEGSESQDGQITAEVVQAELPSPGGTRRVVLLLPDGNLMMTEIDEEQYRSLNLVSS